MEDLEIGESFNYHRQMTERPDKDVTIGQIQRYITRPKESVLVRDKGSTLGRLMPKYN